MFRTILVPVDGSQHSDHALEQAIALATSLSHEVKITILHVSPILVLNEPPIISIEENAEAEGQQILKPAEDKLTAAGVPYDVQLKTGDPSMIITQFADDNQVDLILMGSRGAGLISEILLGSVSHNVIKHAHCPVMVTR
ncbi:universal stress protein [Paenibacillus oryzisoli]|uniref:universal stress protein n=1 Tax=Paenibacillus oryzisoli TaxID=1850517 RepID=UPI003D2AD648